MVTVMALILAGLVWKRREIFRSHGWWAAEKFASGFADSISALRRATLKKPERVIFLAGLETAHGCAINVALGFDTGGGDRRLESSEA